MHTSILHRILLCLCGLALALSLVACGTETNEASDADDAERGSDAVSIESTSAPQLTDPSIDWPSAAEQAIEREDCHALSVILLGAAFSDETDISAYQERYRSLEFCDDAPSALVRFVNMWIGQAVGADLGLPDDILRETRGALSIPLARVHILRVSDAGDFVGPPDGLGALEGQWLTMCEGPLMVYDDYPYQIRRMVARATQDASYLLPDWEDRIEFCLPIAEALLSDYQNWAASQTNPDAQSGFRYADWKWFSTIGLLENTVAPDIQPYVPDLPT